MRKKNDTTVAHVCSFSYFVFFSVVGFIIVVDVPVPLLFHFCMYSMYTAYIGGLECVFFCSAHCSCLQFLTFVLYGRKKYVHSNLNSSFGFNLVQYLIYSILYLYLAVLFKKPCCAHVRVN